MIGGIVSKTAVYPLDLCKKRLQIQKFAQSRTTYGENFVCKGLMDCLSRTVKREGWMGESKLLFNPNKKLKVSLSGLYKGIYPSIVKSGLATGLHFFLYEELLSYFTHVNYKSVTQ